MYMLRNGSEVPVSADMEPVMKGQNLSTGKMEYRFAPKDITEARILSISKDDLRMDEKQLLWTPELEKEVFEYWSTLNGYWNAQTLPKCTCLDNEGGFMGKRSAKGKVYNDFFYEDEPCSLKWYEKTKAEGLWSLASISQ